MAPVEAVLTADKVWKRYSQEVLALENLTFSVYPQEIFGLLGPNGSGKTTTIKLFLGLLCPSQGNIQVLGASPNSLFNRYRLGYQPEENIFPKELTAYELLDFYGRFYGMSRRERKKRSEQVLDLVGISPKDAKRPLHQYSKGMGRRIGLAQALLHNPDILILDEPTAGLDPIGNREFKDLLRTMQDQGKTILISSHLLSDLEDICSRILILYKGKTIQQGKIEELLASKEIQEVLLRYFSPSFEAKLRQVAKEEGVEVLKIQPKRESLEEFFLKTVQGAENE